METRPDSAQSQFQKVPPWVKPMTIGGIVDRSLKIYRQAFLVFVLIALVAQTPNFLSQAFFDAAKASKSPLANLPGLILSLIGIILTIWGTAAIIHLGASRFLGRNIGFKDAASKALSNLGSLIWAGFLYSLILFIPFIFVGGGAAILVPMFLKSDGGPNLILLALIGGLVVFAIAWYVSVLISFSLYNQAVVIEDKRGRASLRRSRKLIRERGEKGFFKNNIWRLSIIYTILLVIWGALFFAPAIPGLLIKLGTLGATAVPPWFKTLTYVAQLAGQIFVFPIGVLALTVFYYDIRIRGEGLDMELRAGQEKGPSVQP